MAAPDEHRWTRPQDLGQIGAALGVAVWRICSRPPSALPTDLLLIIAGYWLFTVLAGKSRAWWPVTLVVMGALFAIHVSGYLPDTIEALQLAP
jgi:hypothetical protein